MKEFILAFLIFVLTIGWIVGGMVYWVNYEIAINGVISTSSDRYKPVPFLISIACGPAGWMYGFTQFVEMKAASDARSLK